MRKSISVQFFSLAASVLLLGVLVMGLSEMVLFTRYFSGERFANLEDAGRSSEEAAAALIAEHPQTDPEELVPELALRLELIGKGARVGIFVADSAGNIRNICIPDGTEGPESTSVPTELLEAAAAEPGRPLREYGTLSGVMAARYYVSIRSLTAFSEPEQLTLFVYSPARRFSPMPAELFSNFLVSALMMLVIAGMLTVLAIGKVTEPLHRISEAAQRFGGGDYSARAEGIDGDDEIAALAKSFNTMADNLEQADRSRAQFSGNIAHELRTPMTTIKGFVDGILDGTIPPEMEKHYLGLVSQETGRLARLVQNMLDLSKMESGEYPVNARIFNIWDTVTGAALSAEQRINDGQIEIEGLTLDRFPVYADPDLIHQVVYNLLDNAIKFTPPGGVIRFSAEKLGPEAEISVWNSGQGIAPEALPHVFDRFYKEDRSRGLNARGAGLGLHICKVLVNLSGGRIRAESEQGEWCRFVFTLPTEPPDRSGRLKLPEEAGSSGKDTPADCGEVHPV